MADALAVFVKTPGLSPVKTRLAEHIGTREAERFYQRSCAAIRSLMKEWEGQGGASFWAVAEKPAPEHRVWSDFVLVPQGEGDLGARLAHVYATLLRAHERVFLIGADAPQLGLKDLQDAQGSLVLHDFVIGPARDGGFYLFGGKKAIPTATWQSVAYSAATTREELLTNLAPIGQAAVLSSVLTDVDTLADLAALRAEMQRATGPASEILRAWLQKFKARSS